MKRSLLSLGVLLALGILFACWLLFRPNPVRNSFQIREIATRGLADYLARHQVGHQVLVIANPFIHNPDTPKAIVEMEEAGIRGLTAGLGANLHVQAIAFPELKPEAKTDPRSVPIDRETTTPLSFLVAVDAFDQLVAAHPDCDVIVSLIGMPIALHRVRAWTDPGGPRFALLLPDLHLMGGLGEIQHAFQSGKLAAFILPKPGAPGSEIKASGRWQAEFDKRYLLVTADNFAETRQAHPELFPDS